jgi:hypothetical protein
MNADELAERAREWIVKAEHDLATARQVLEDDAAEAVNMALKVREAVRAVLPEASMRR